ncbi:MAG TPA: helix-turn-helix domain-containing protein [Gemmatimonadales bacterium]|nr:helix-turn-helix domain-containing protein [Gemmatimonadales bacterium]
MPAFAALIPGRASLATLRRSLPRGGIRLMPCRTRAQLLQLLRERLMDGVILGAGEAGTAEIPEFRAQFPVFPLVAWGGIRPDDGEALAAWTRAGATVLVEGVDDAVAGELLKRATLAAERRRQLSDAPRLLRLTDPLQRHAWELVVETVDRPARTSELARALAVSREHLSRQFGAGGAPNLKRVIDLVRVVTAAQLLGNPALEAVDVARVLHFASLSHLNRTTRRITGHPASELPRLGPRGVLTSFARGNTRSRA